MIRAQVQLPPSINMLLILMPGWLCFTVLPAEATQPAQHLQADCSVCHDYQKNQAASSDALCLECHAQGLHEADLIAGIFHKADDRACSRCHSFHAVKMLKAADRIFERPFQDERVLVQCRNCHREDSEVQSVSAGHYQAAQYYHVDAADLSMSGASTICLQCHDRDMGSGEIPSNTPAFPVHGSHPVGVSIPVVSPWEASGFRTSIDVELELVNRRLECSTCHRLSAETVFRLVPFASVTALCNGCHDMAPGNGLPNGEMEIAVSR